MVVFWQSGCVSAKVVVFGQNWLYLVKSGCIRAKMVVLVQSCFIRVKVVVLRQRGCTHEK